MSGASGLASGPGVSTWRISGGGSRAPAYDPPFFDEPDGGRRPVYDLVIGAQGVGIAAMRDGEDGYAATDRLARGWGAHEWPALMAGEELILRAGMTFTVEPRVSLPDQGFIRVEEVVLVTPDGGGALTRSPHALTVAGASRAGRSDARRLRPRRCGR